MWYYALNGQPQGPVGADELERLVNAGTLTPYSLVWREGMANWLPYRQAVQGAPDAPAFAPPGIHASAPARSGEPLPFVFTGLAGEYFKIWIVNVLLTVVTLGIYAAWAKVRKKRYFYANTQLAGHAFEYLADPKRLLIGNLVVGVGFLIYSASSSIGPQVQLPLALVVMAAVPWLIARSFLFNARNSAWRGLRFGFAGRYGGAAKVFILWPMLLPFTMGLIWPLIAKKRRQWIVKRHRFGTTPFEFNAETGHYYAIYLKALLFFLPLLVAYVLFFINVASTGGRGTPPNVMYSGLIGVFFIAGALCAFAGGAFLRARLFTYQWSSTRLGPHSFQAGMRARDLLGLQVVNMLVLIVSLGFAWPWVAVRTARFQLSCIELVPVGNLDSFVAGSQPPVSALGEVAADFLDFDLGVGV